VAAPRWHAARAPGLARRRSRSVTGVKCLDCRLRIGSASAGPGTEKRTRCQNTTSVLPSRDRHARLESATKRKTSSRSRPSLRLESTPQGSTRIPPEASSRIIVSRGVRPESGAGAQGGFVFEPEFFAGHWHCGRLPDRSVSRSGGESLDEEAHCCERAATSWATPDRCAPHGSSTDFTGRPSPILV